MAKKLLVNDTLMIPFMVDYPNHDQTWSPPLLKIENLTKKLIKNLEKSRKRPIDTKLSVNDVFMIPCKNYG